MKVHRDIEGLSFGRTVVTIGSFDGVHAGHVSILKQVSALARERDCESVVVTFYPHPRQVLYPNENQIRLLTTVAEKSRVLEQHGIDHLVVVPFSQAFYSLSPEDYVREFLVARLHPSVIVVGYDHRFGANRGGDIELLRAMSAEGGFEVQEISRQEVDDIGVSSTKIRKAIEAKDIDTANRLLGRPYSLSGTVVKGEQIGRTIGFPTANVAVESGDKLVPPTGIYAVWVQVNDKKWGGMLYIGSRPVIGSNLDRSIEVNIFDFDYDIYGQEIGLTFEAFVRNDIVLKSLNELKTQLALDEAQIRNILKTKASPRTAVMILNFNTRDMLNRFLPGVIERSDGLAEIVVADNGSKDDSVALLTSEYGDQVRCLALPENYGFAGGYNRAIEEVDAEYLVLLNSDIEVSEGWLQPLIAAMDANPKLAACQPKILAYHAQNTFEYAGAAGGFLDAWGYPYCRGRIFDEVETDQGQYNTPISCFWATGAAMVVRADVFKKLGGFDASFFAHMEEIDLCWRMRRAGYNVMVVPQSVVWHVGGGTLAYQSPRKTYLNFRNALMTQIKNEPSSRLWWLLIWRLSLDGVAGLYLGLKQGFAHTLQIVYAHWWVFWHIGELWRRRSETARLIEDRRIGPENMAGRSHFSILWQFHGRKKRRYSEL